jgi:tRNA(Ile)-lysidine synthase
MINPMSSKQPEPAVVRTVKNRLRQACRSIQLLSDHRRLLLGCSAGGDSMSLLDLVHAEATRRKWEIAVVHLDHAQRAESADEAAFVSSQAACRTIPVFTDRIDDSRLKKEPLSEDAMRKARHRVYGKAMKLFRADAILLAHQADDRAETFLIRLLAGSGPTGLASIRPVEEVGGIKIVRPLLSLRRKDLRDYLRWRGLEWHDDPGNESQVSKRSWVRHGLIPMIEQKIELDPTERISSAAELLDDESRVLHQAIKLLLEQLTRTAPEPAIETFDLRHGTWKKADKLLRRQLLRHWIWRLRNNPHPPGRKAVEEALRFIEQGQPGTGLRTVEGMMIVHAKQKLVVFNRDTGQTARRTAVLKYFPIQSKNEKP